jgi:hypothetical protein
MIAITNDQFIAFKSRYRVARAKVAHGYNPDYFKGYSDAYKEIFTDLGLVE